MTITNENGTTVLTAAPGKYLTDGQAYGTVVRLGCDAKAEDWQEVDSLPEEMIPQEEARS